MAWPSGLLSGTEDSRNIVVAPVLIGLVNQGLNGLGYLGLAVGLSGGQVLADGGQDVLVGNDSVDAIGAKEKEVLGGDGVSKNVHLGGLFVADSSHENILSGVSGGLFSGIDA